MTDWKAALDEWGASPTMILILHAEGEHRDNPSIACLACNPSLHEQPASPPTSDGE